MAEKKPTSSFGKYKVIPSEVSGKKHSVKAVEILGYGVDSTISFYELFEKEKRGRQTKGGYTTNAEQDLLRSMLVFSAATLDICVKQTIRDMLKIFEEKDEKVRNEFISFVKKAITKDDKNELLSELFVSENSKDVLIEDYIYELTGSSLQSIEEIYKSIAALNIDLKIDNTVRKEYKEIFNIRNKIIHELDYDFDRTSPRTRTRIQRKQDEMINASEKILKLTKDFILSATIAEKST